VTCFLNELLRDIRATLARAPLSRLFPPLRDLRVVALEQHLWNGVPAVDARSRVVGVVETALSLKRLFDGGLIVTQRAGDQSNDGLGDGECSDLSAGEYEIAQGDLFPVQDLPQTLIESFVATAAEQHAFVCLQTVRGRLSERHPLGGKQDFVKEAVTTLEPLHAFDDRLWFQNHAGAAPEGTIVDRAVSISSEVSEVYRHDIDQPALPSPT